MELTREQTDMLMFVYQRSISSHIIPTISEDAADNPGLNILPPDPLWDLPVSNMTGGEYIANTKIFLTYAKDIERAPYVEWLTAVSANKNVSVDEVSLARELDVTHVLVIWKKAFRSRDVSVMDYEGVRPSLRYVSKPCHLERVRDFLSWTNNTYILSST